jgi:hypothetical protein
MRSARGMATSWVNLLGNSGVATPSFSQKTSKSPVFLIGSAYYWYGSGR